MTAGPLPADVPLWLPRPGFRDAVEVLLVAFLVYRLLRILSGTRSLRMVVGLLVLIAAYVVAVALGFRTLTYLLGVVFTYGAVAAIVVFQPELRQALARLGEARPFAALAPGGGEALLDELGEAIERLRRTSTGAIIAIERSASLDEYAESGRPMDASVSADLLTTIFSPYSPLHDGAVLIRGDRIIGAGAILPLTQAPVSDRTLGTRHRAALGLSEETDAVVCVVSEETGAISVAEGGRLERGVTVEAVRERLLPP